MNKQQFEKLITTDSGYRFTLAEGRISASLRHYTSYSDLKDICDFPKKAKNLSDYYKEPEKDVLILQINFTQYRIENRTFTEAKTEICERIKEFFAEIVLSDIKAIKNGHFSCFQEANK